MLGKLEGLLGDSLTPSEGETTVVVECRRCGTSLEGIDSCPYCDDTETVRFEI